VVFASTFRVYPCLRSPDACSPYASAKLAAEQDCVAFTRDLGPESVCLRYFNVYGPRQPVSGLDWRGLTSILRALHADHRPVIHGSGKEPLDVIHVDDVVHATMLAAEAPRVAGRIYDIGRGSPITILEIVKTVGAIAGVEMLPVHATNGAAEMTCLADVSRAEIELGFCPTVNLEQGLRRCIADHQTLPDEMSLAQGSTLLK
jgi:UDP-glucose 4-epimerase